VADGHPRPPAVVASIWPLTRDSVARFGAVRTNQGLQIMQRDRIVRTALGASVPFNLGAAYLFARPDSAFAKGLGIPGPAPPLYCALVALFLVLFAGAYAWLCRSREIARPLVAFAAIGKSLAFFTFVFLWLLSLGPGGAAVASLGDAFLAGIFLWWLLTRRPNASS
jgi:hypothetical protein